LRPFADRILERFANLAKVKQIELRNEIPETAPLIQADPEKLSQILANLVDNAVKYSAEGGKVWIRSAVESNQARIEVEDDGPGISARDQERIFERFYRVDKARTRGSGGAGLGLAIVKHLVELHGGRVTVDSSPGRGSKFTISFPVSTKNPAKTR